MNPQAMEAARGQVALGRERTETYATTTTRKACCETRPTSRVGKWGTERNHTMSKNTMNAECSTAKKAKVILRKPSGTKISQGWAGEIINPDGTRAFVPEAFREELEEAEINMTKIGHMIKAIADATVFAASKELDVSAIIKRWGVDCVTMWADFQKHAKARKEARAKAEDGLKTPEERRAAWDKVKEPYNSAVRRASLKMELLAEDILAGEPKKAIG